jgi:hypothetical protein
MACEISLEVLMDYGMEAYLAATSAPERRETLEEFTEGKKRRRSFVFLRLPTAFFFAQTFILSSWLGGHGSVSCGPCDRYIDTPFRN